MRTGIVSRQAGVIDLACRPRMPATLRAPVPLETEERGPQGAPGPAFIGFGQITYTERTVGPEDAFPANSRGQVLFTPDPTLTQDLLNAPFTGHGFWVGNRVVAFALDDLYDIQVNLIVTTQVAGGRVRMDADVGSPLGPVASDTQTLFNGAGVSERVTFRLRLQVLGFFKQNGAALFLTSTVPLTVISETVLVAPASQHVAS